LVTSHVGQRLGDRLRHADETPLFPVLRLLHSVRHHPTLVAQSPLPGGERAWLLRRQSLPQSTHCRKRAPAALRARRRIVEHRRLPYLGVLSERTPPLHRRIQGLDWPAIGRDLDALGHAVVRDLLSPADCAAMARLYGEEKRFRSRVIMA